MGVNMFHHVFRHIHAGGLFVILPGVIEGTTFFVIKGFFKERMPCHVGAAAVDLTFKHGRVDRLAGIVGVDTPEELHLACLHVHIDLNGSGDEVE